MLASCRLCVQIKQHDAASGHSCPAHMSIPGAATQVNVFRLVAVTGERFLHAFQNLSAPTVPSKRRAGLRSRPDADNDNAGGSRASSAPDSDAMERTQTSQTGAEAAAAEAFVSIVEIRAPESLTPQQVRSRTIATGLPAPVATWMVVRYW